MADYWVYATKRANNGRGKITHMKVFDASGQTLRDLGEKTIDIVIKSILNGDKVWTCTSSGNGNYSQGERLHPYIHSDPNKKTSDNLDNLPVYV